MRIVNGKKFYKREIDAAQKLGFSGWDTYNGQNYQWYTVLYNPDCDLVILDANNSGNCFGDYETYYFDSPIAFFKWADEENARGYGQYWDLAKLFGDVDEANETEMGFVGKFVDYRKGEGK